MKLFIIKTVCFIFGFWLLTYFLANLADGLAPMNVYSQGEAERLKALLEKKDTVQAISLGNSHTDAIDFDTLGILGKNLARAGTDLYEVKLYTESVVTKLPKLETVFISISYFSFTRDNVLLDDTRNLRIELYSSLPTWRSLPGDEDSLILGKLHRYFNLMSIVRPDHWESVFTAALENKTGEEDLPLFSVTTKTPWGECPHYTQNELNALGDEIAYKAAKNHLKLLSLDANIQNKSYQILADTVETLQKRDIRVILFTPPYYTSYNERFNDIAPEMIEEMHLSIENIQKQYNVEYYDAASMPEFSSHPELFYNSDHLNECGKRAFSSYVKTEIEKKERRDE